MRVVSPGPGEKTGAREVDGVAQTEAGIPDSRALSHRGWQCTRGLASSPPSDPESQKS